MTEREEPEVGFVHWTMTNIDPDLLTLLHMRANAFRVVPEALDAIRSAIIDVVNAYDVVLTPRLICLTCGKGRDESFTCSNAFHVLPVLIEPEEATDDGGTALHG